MIINNTSDDYIEKCFSAHANMIYRLAYARTKNKHDADDILQEVFIRFMTSNTRFNDEEHMKAWFIRVTINCSNTYLKSSWQRRIVAMEEVKDYKHAIYIEEKGDLYYAVLDLPIKQRTVIHLFYNEDYSTKEIAEFLDMKEGTVRSLLSRARSTLRKKLQGVDFDV